MLIVCAISIGGIAPPVEEWKKVIDDMNSRTRKLEEDYEGTCIQKKVSGCSIGSFALGF